MILRVTDAKTFLTGIEPFLREARQEFGDRLREGREEYQGIAIQSYVTPQREVSSYRATFGEFVAVSNSPAGLRRVIDVHLGKRPPLADSGDFKYMRTIFKRNDPARDGFAFLSDPFIRQLVGPASKIKEKRRLEGLTSLTMASNAALFHARR